jgi:hypothetical protein
MATRYGLRTDGSARVEKGEGLRTRPPAAAGGERGVLVVPLAALFARLLLGQEALSEGDRDRVRGAASRPSISS